MKLLLLALLLYLTVTLAQETTYCCLCADCELVPYERLHVALMDTTCGDLEVAVLETDADDCDNTHKEARRLCCAAPLEEDVLQDSQLLLQLQDEIYEEEDSKHSWFEATVLYVSESLESVHRRLWGQTLFTVQPRSDFNQPPAGSSTTTSNTYTSFTAGNSGHATSFGTLSFFTYGTRTRGSNYGNYYSGTSKSGTTSGTTSVVDSVVPVETSSPVEGKPQVSQTQQQQQVLDSPSSSEGPIWANDNSHCPVTEVEAIAIDPIGTCDKELVNPDRIINNYGGNARDQCGNCSGVCRGQAIGECDSVAHVFNDGNSVPIADGGGNSRTCKAWNEYLRTLPATHNHCGLMQAALRKKCGCGCGLPDRAKCPSTTYAIDPNEQVHQMVTGQANAYGWTANVP